MHTSKYHVYMQTAGQNLTLAFSKADELLAQSMPVQTRSCVVIPASGTNCLGILLRISHD